MNPNPKSELLLEGSYQYLQNEVEYCQENFKLVQLVDLNQFHINAEILSRIETGEFLKIIIQYEMTNNFIPYFVRIEKFIGSKYAQEIYKYDLSTQELHYSFQDADSTHESTKNHNAKHYLTSPAFSTSAIWTLSKKMDATGRTAITVVSSPNEWTHEGPPTDKVIFAEIKSRELNNYKLNNTSLPAAHLCLYEFDTTYAVSEMPVDIYISKHFAIPYQLIQGDLKINIKNLKKHT